jgi:hypothetical protein
MYKCKVISCAKTHIFIIKEFVQPKMSLNREFLIWKEEQRNGEVREREREREVCKREKGRGGAYLRLG